MSEIQTTPVRPQLGEWRTFNATTSRQTVSLRDYNRDRKEWQVNEPKEQRGVYIGYRTVADGIREYFEDEGYHFIPESYREVWLFAVNPRQKPVYVFPECVTQSNQR